MYYFPRDYEDRTIRKKIFELLDGEKIAFDATANILYIKEFVGLSRLPLNLKQMAEVRLEYPEATLKELGQYLEPPVGKSGVNHRLRKLSEIADFHRGHGKG